MELKHNISFNLKEKVSFDQQVDQSQGRDRKKEIL